MNWRKWFWLYLFMMLTISCASAPIPHHDMPEPAEIEKYVVPNTMPDYMLLCVQRPFGDGPTLGPWDCVSIEELRQMVKHLSRADN